LLVNSIDWYRRDWNKEAPHKRRRKCGQAGRQARVLLLPHHKIKGRRRRRREVETSFLFIF